MKFDLEKFVNFNITGYVPYVTEEGGCLKCAVLYAMGYKAVGLGVPIIDRFLKRVTYSQVAPLRSHFVNLSNESNLFSEKVSIEFAQLIDVAEQKLKYFAPVESVKKFVIDGMIEQGLIKVEETNSTPIRDTVSV